MHPAQRFARRPALRGGGVGDGDAGQKFDQAGRASGDFMDLAAFAVGHGARHRIAGGGEMIEQGEEEG